MQIRSTKGIGRCPMAVSEKVAPSCSSKFNKDKVEVLLLNVLAEVRARFVSGNDLSSEVSEIEVVENGWVAPKGETLVIGSG